MTYVTTASFGGKPRGQKAHLGVCWIVSCPHFFLEVLVPRTKLDHIWRQDPWRSNFFKAGKSWRRLSPLLPKSLFKEQFGTQQTRICLHMMQWRRIRIRKKSTAIRDSASEYTTVKVRFLKSTEKTTANTWDRGKSSNYHCMAPREAREIDSAHRRDLERSGFNNDS